MASSFEFPTCLGKTARVCPGPDFGGRLVFVRRCSARPLSPAPAVVSGCSRFSLMLLSPKRSQTGNNAPKPTDSLPSPLSYVRTEDFLCAEIQQLTSNWLLISCSACPQSP